MHMRFILIMSKIYLRTHFFMKLFTLFYEIVNKGYFFKAKLYFGEPDF